MSFAIFFIALSMFIELFKECSLKSFWLEAKTPHLLVVIIPKITSSTPGEFHTEATKVDRSRKISTKYRDKEA